MSEQIMVRSRLKTILNERNIERLQRNQPILSGRQLAADSGLPPSVVSGLINGSAGRVDFRTLDKLCRVLNCVPGDILEYVPDTDPASAA